MGISIWMRLANQGMVSWIDATACRSATKLSMNYHQQNMRRVVRRYKIKQDTLDLPFFGWVIFVVSGTSFLRKTWHTLWHWFCYRCRICFSFSHQLWPGNALGKYFRLPLSQNLSKYIQRYCRFCRWHWQSLNHIKSLTYMNCIRTLSLLRNGAQSNSSQQLLLFWPAMPRLASSWPET